MSEVGAKGKEKVDTPSFPNCFSVRKGKKIPELALNCTELFLWVPSRGNCAPQTGLRICFCNELTEAPFRRSHTLISSAHHTDHRLVKDECEAHSWKGTHETLDRSPCLGVLCAVPTRQLRVGPGGVGRDDDDIPGFI